MAKKTDIRLRRSNVLNAIPGAANLSEGELALNTNTGALYFKKSDGTIITAADNTIFHIDSDAANSSANKKIGIGTTSPEGLMHFASSSDYDIVFDNTSQEKFKLRHGTSGLYLTGPDTSTLAFGVDQNHDVRMFNISGSAYATFDGSTSRVGIGTASPATNLEISGSAPKLRITDTRDQTFTVGDIMSSIEFDSDDTSGGAGTSSEPRAAINMYAASTFGSSTGLEFRTKGDTTGYPVQRMIIDSSGNVGIGTDAPGEKLEVVGNVEAEEFIGDLRGALLFKAQAGEALSKGDVVYISGISGNTTVVSKADADDSAKMPAFGVAAAAANLNSAVDIYTFGTLSGIDTSSYSEGDELYVSTTAGALTSTAPTGSGSLIQKIAKVTRSDASAGSIKVIGAGRTNAVPNLDQYKIFVGNSSNQAVQGNNALTVDIDNNAVGINTGDPDAYVSSLGARLHIATNVVLNSNTPLLYLRANGGSAMSEIRYQNSLKFTNGSATLHGFIDSSGRLTFGSATNFSDANADDFQIGNTSGAHGITIVSQNSQNASIYFADNDNNDAGRIAYNHTNNRMEFYTDRTQRLVIDSDGNVGIGEQPRFKVSIKTPAILSGSTYAWPLDLSRPNTENRGLTFGIAASGTTNAIAGHNADVSIGHTFGIDSNGLPQYYETLRVQHIDQAVGRVGIGTTSPDSKLTVNVSTNSDGIELQSNETSIAKLSRTTVGSTVVPSLDGVIGRPIHIGGIVNEDVILANAGGSVGIGTTLPEGTLHVKSTGNSEIDIERASGAKINIQAQSAAGYIGTDTNHVFGLKANSTVRLKIATSGAITFNDAFTFPTSIGSAGQVLKVPSTGTTLVWANDAGGGSATVLTDTDGDTKIQVEESADEDIIRFDIAGTEQMQLNSTGLTVAGNLTVNGTQTILNTATLSVDDLNITVADGAANAAAANGAGLTVDGASATWTYSSGDDAWASNKHAQFYTFGGTGTLSVGRTSDQAIRLYADDNYNRIFAYQDSDTNGDHYFDLVRSFQGTGKADFRILNGSSIHMLIDKSGHVGIGTSNPTSHINTGTFFKPDSNGKFLTINGASNGSFIMLESQTTTDSDQIGGIYWNRTGAQGDAHKHVAGIDVIQDAYAPNDVLEGGTLRFFTKPSGSGTNSPRMVINGSGYVGIGTSSPNVSLEVAGSMRIDNGASFTALEIYRDSTLYGYVGSGSNQLTIQTQNNKSLNLFADSGVGITIIDGGNVGIGTDSPVSTLEVKGASATSNNGGTVLVTDNASVAADIGGTIALRGTDGTTDRTYGLIKAGKLNSTSGAFDGYLSLQTRTNGQANTTEAIRINNIQNVGIGTSSPTEKLHVKATNGSIAIDANGASNTASIKFINDNERSRISSNYDTGGGGRLTFHTDTTGGSLLERMRIDNAGNVGIGITNPGAKLQVNGSIVSEGGSFASAQETASDAGLVIQKNDYIYSDDNNYLRKIIGHTATNHIQIGQQGTALIGDILLYPGSTGNVRIFASGSEDVTIASSGNVGIGATTIDDGNLQIGDSDADFNIAIAGARSKFGYDSSNNSAVVQGGITKGIMFCVNNSTFGSGEAGRFDASGNLLVGTTSSFGTGGTAKLSVAGILSIGISNSDMSYIRRQSAGNYAWQTYDNNNTGSIQLQPYGGNVGIGSTSPSAKLQVEEYGIDTSSTTTTATTQVPIHTFPVADFRTARFTIQITNTTDSTYHSTEIIAVHDGTTANITEFGEVHTGTSVEATFDADISSGNFRLLATPASTDSMTFKVVCHSITV